MNEVTLTDALKVFGLKPGQVLNWSEKPDRFVIVTKPAGQKFTIMKVNIKPESTTANITEVTPAEAKPVVEIATGQFTKVKEVGSEPPRKVLPIRKRTDKKAVKKTTKKKK